MGTRTITIVGAGISGLSAGIYAQLNGYESTVYEKNPKPGGVAAWWKRGEYLIDGGIHFLPINDSSLKVSRLYREIGVDEIPMRELQLYGRYYDFKSGLEIDIEADLSRFENVLREHFPDDSEHIDELVSMVRDLSQMDLTDFGFEKPIELMGLRDKIGEMWAMRELMKYTRGNYAKPVEDYIETVKDERLANLLQRMFLPCVPMWFLGMILGQLVSGQLAILERGSESFVRAMEKRFLELGGSVEYDNQVEKILVDSNRVVGIRLSNGSEIHSDYIIPAIDTKVTIYRLLDGRYTNDAIDRRHNEVEFGAPLLLASFGVRRSMDDEPWLMAWRLDEPFTIGDRSIHDMIIRVFNYGEFAPLESAVIQVEFETEWDHWKSLRETDVSAYEREKERISERILDCLETKFEGIKRDVEIIDVATPYTMWRYTSNRQGAYMGYLPTSEMLTMRLRKTLPGLERCYLAGQWTMGMGGVIPSIHSGRHAIQLVCNEEGMTFRA